MDDLTLLRQHRADVHVDEAALVRQRARLARHDDATARRWSRRASLRTVCALAVVLLAGAGAVWYAGPRGVPPAAAAVLTRASEVAARQEEPAPGEYLHARTVTHRWLDGERDTSVTETWVSGRPGEAPIVRGIEGLVYRMPTHLPRISSDVGASGSQVARWLRRDDGDLRGDAAAVERATDVLNEPEMPRAFRGKVLRALATIEGVELRTDDARLDGQSVSVLEYSHVFRQQLIFANTTGRLVAMRAVDSDGKVGTDGTYSAALTEGIVERLPARARVTAEIRGSNGELVPLGEAPSTG